MKDIEPLNKSGQPHGYCERYWHHNGKLEWKGVVFHDKSYGYFEFYNLDSSSINEDDTGYYFDDDKISDDNEEGYCYIWNKGIHHINRTDRYERRQGYWETYLSRDEGLSFKGNYSNGMKDGYCESYWNNGRLNWKGLAVYGRFHGYIECYHEDGSVGVYMGYFIDGRRISIDNREGYCYIWDKKAK